LGVDLRYDAGKILSDSSTPESSTMGNLPSYEKLGQFYLGRKYDLSQRKLGSENVLYDAKDMTTHALCVGMTGSGKTGLCLSLLEEAAIDGIPAICVDPKGDLGNLLLSFPDLAPKDFEPWVEQRDATREGMDRGEYAAHMASKWKDGLAAWDQTPDRIRKFREAVDISIYTPGSNAGLPLTVLKSFDAPPPEVQNDSEAMREKITSAASGLLTLLGMEADPLTSREHILLSTIFDQSWRAGENLDLAELIRRIQNPPIERVGVMDLESFLPTKERSKFAMCLNNLLASPSFAGWLEGESLDIKKLLYTSEGKPRLTILSISHLNDSERMFFVTLLLGELLSWVRTQPGTSSLRAMFYMDEVYGYFPPTSKPPSKPPMLTLLKQSRAFGLGICLATQNPMDLDYKGLSNMGTWFLGRLQSQRDKDRVLEGLEGAAANAGSTFNRSKMEQTLAALGSRVFLMNNVHDDAPTIFQTRWALSFLRGPLSRQQIQTLMADKRAAAIATNDPTNANASSSQATESEKAGGARPVVPSGIPERFLDPAQRASNDSRLIYRPALLGQASLHFVRASAKVDHWQDVSLLVEFQGGFPSPVWVSGRAIHGRSFDLMKKPYEKFGFSELPKELLNAKKFGGFEKSLVNHLYRHHNLSLLHCKALKQFSKAGQSEDDARIELSLAAREARDLAVEKIRSKFAPKLKTLENRMERAEQKLAKEKEQSKHESFQSMLGIGTSILGALLGNKLASRTNVSKASTAARGLGRAARERGDVARAEDTLENIREDMRVMQDDCQAAVDTAMYELSLENLELEPLEIRPRKSDIRVSSLCLLWVPYQIDDDGIASPLVSFSFPTTQ
jgi:hypothetical protein